MSKFTDERDARNEAALAAAKLALPGVKWKKYPHGLECCVYGKVITVWTGSTRGRVGISWEGDQGQYKDLAAAMRALRDDMIRHQAALQRALGPAQEGDWVPSDA